MQRLDPSSSQGDAVNIHQLAQGAGVFGHKHIRARQHIQRPERDVARRSDRNADKPHSAAQNDIDMIQSWTRLFVRL